MEFLSKEKSNSFNSQNGVRCFNHTLQLSAKALLRPFSVKIDDDQDNEDDVDADEPEAEDPDDLSYLNANTDNDDEDNEALDIGGEEDEEEVDDDGIDELDDLGPYTRSALLNETQEVRHALSKVCITNNSLQQLKNHRFTTCLSLLSDQPL